MSTEFTEPHYKLATLAKMWRISRERLRLIFCDEPGVVKILGKTKKRTLYSIPESVARRVHLRLQSIGR